MSTTNGSNRSPYVKLTDEQKRILYNFFDEGMTGTGQKHDALVTKASEMANLPKDKVKKWIGNESRKRKNSAAPLVEEPTEKKVCLPPFKRGQTQYNAFCAAFFKEECCKGVTLEEKNKMASIKWNSLTPQEKEKYKDIAITKREINVSNLTTEDKEKIAKSFIKQITDQVTFLGSIGGTVSMLVLTPGGKLLGAGTEEGQDFFSSNPDVVLRFRQHFDQANVENFTYRDVMKLFNSKYSEAVGRPSRVPYLKGGFRVEGLPDGIVFRKPYTYGKRQVKAIMTSQDNIQFFINEDTDDREIPPPKKADQLPKTSVWQNQVLAKILGNEEASAVVRNQTRVTEDMVEVIDLTLSQNERLVLYHSCRQFFDVDAWCAVGKNMRHDDRDNRIILPVYNLTDEPYWLFYFPGRLDVVLRANPGTKLTGYWLDIWDVESGRKYKKMSEKSNIQAKNIIKTDHGALYYAINTELPSDDVWEIPPIFHDTILNILNYNLLS